MKEADLGDDDRDAGEAAGGSRLVPPDTSAAAIRQRAALVEPTAEQSEAFWREHASQMLSPDDAP